MTNLTTKQKKTKERMMKDKIDMNTIKGEMLLELVKHHKKTCPGEDCTISLYHFLSLYSQLIGRPANNEEMRYFL